MTTIKIDKLIRSKRRTLHLEVGTDARLTVRVPSRCSNTTIEKFVEERKDWITNRQRYAREHCKQVSPKKYLPGDKFLYMGKEHELLASASGEVPLMFNGEYFVIGVNCLNDAPELFRSWYKQAASKVISERAKHYSLVTGLKYQKIRITCARHRWGSCSIKGNLNFTASLIMAPLEVIDCVVVHELVHVEIKGHRNGFWDKVKTYIPDLESGRNWLNENQNLLSL